MAELRIRDSAEHERASTPLELLFDLCFVVAVAILAKDLHHAISEDRATDGALTYAGLFVPVWWAWMSFTWFATAFDNDDVVHRLLTMAQMLGVVGLAATVHRAAEGDLSAFGVAVALLRAPLVAQWLRAATYDVEHRAFARTYAVGLTLGAVVWLAGTRLDLPPALAVLAVAVLVDLVTPVLAVQQAPGPIFHPGHIAERYGLFTIIVVGESILAMTVALESAVEDAVGAGSLVAVVAGGAAVTFATWWIYFDALGRDGLTRNRAAAFWWGYGHYLVFAAVAAAGAGVQVQVDLLLHHGPSERVASAAVAVPAALALVAVAFLQVVANRRVGSAPPLLVGAALLLATPLVGRVEVAGPLVALVLVATAVVVARQARPIPVSASTRGGVPGAH